MAESDLIRGNVDTIILKILYEGDRYAYDLIKQINARGDGQWEIKQPTVYACLKRLEKRKFISSYWDDSESEGGRRKYYKLTETGKEVFIKYKNEFDRATALYGGIINGADPILQDDSYDVEDEGYAVPKRPSKPRPRVKKTEPPVVEPIVEEQPPIVEEQLVVTEQPPIVEEQPVITEQPPIVEEQPAVTEQQPVVYEDVVTEQQPVITEQPPVVEEPVVRRTAPVVEPPVATADPRAILQSIFDAENGSSYEDARRNGEPLPLSREELRPETQPQPAPPAPQPQPVVRDRTPSPVVTPERTPQPIRDTQPTTPAPVMPEQESEARRMYRSIIGDLIDNSEMAEPDIRTAPAPTQQRSHDAPVEEAAAASTAAEPRYSGMERSMRKLGNDISIRTPNDSAKQFNDKNYYYGNKLTLNKYIALCSTMLAVAFAMFLVFYVAFGMYKKYDYLLYIGAGLLPIIMFLVAVVKFWNYPDKRKRVQPSYAFSISMRFIILLQVAVVVYCVNLIMGMPVGFAVDYLPTLLIPLAYALFIPISEIADMYMVRSKHYSIVEQD